MTMASSKKSLTEKQQIVEGFLDRIVNAALGKTDRKAKAVLDTLTSKDTALAKAQDDLEKANDNLRKVVKKRMKSIKRGKKADAKLSADLAKLGF